MNELQATLEFSVELYKFYNVDLFQRGLYQIRCALRVSPKLRVQIEVSVPEPGRGLGSASLAGDGYGSCRPFQILYRNEEISLRDVLFFRAHMLVDSRRLKESLERPDFSIILELWFAEQTPIGCETLISQSSGGMALVSTRTLQLNFSPVRGLHYHLPVLFDYFHLSAISITIHANLVALHQPYIKKSIMHYVQSCTPRSAKPWLGSGKFSFRTPQQAQIHSSLEAVFFGSGNSAKCGGGTSATKLAQARIIHQAVCAVLLESYEALRNAFQESLSLLPQWQQSQLGHHGDVSQRLRKLGDLTKHLDVDEDFAARANSDIAQLCAENIVQWQHFLAAVCCKPAVHQHLAKKHHTLRVKRFAEAFFVLDNPRHSAAGCYDANYQNYLAISELARRSRYLTLLPSLPVHCVALDGDVNTIPIIFEDQYQDTVEFARRRSAGRKSGSDPFLSSGISEPSLLAQDDCSCGISAILEARSNSRAEMANVCESKLMHCGNMVQASLTIAPNASSHLQTSTLPARHSKSLDQLRINMNSVSNASTLPRSVLATTDIHKLKSRENHDSKYLNDHQKRNNGNDFEQHKNDGFNLFGGDNNRQTRSANHSMKVAYGESGKHRDGQRDKSGHYYNDFKPENRYGAENQKLYEVSYQTGTRRNNGSEYNREINDIYHKNYQFNEHNVDLYGKSSLNLVNYDKDVKNYGTGFQNSTLPRPILPPRNSYPPRSMNRSATGQYHASSAPNPQIVHSAPKRHIPRSNSTQIFPRSVTEFEVLFQNPGSIRHAPQSTKDLRVYSDAYHVSRSHLNSSNGCRDMRKGYKETLRKSANNILDMKQTHENSYYVVDEPLHQYQFGAPKTSSSRHKLNEKARQARSTGSSSSSTESDSIPSGGYKRLEGSASVPLQLGRTGEFLRHARSAASVLDEMFMNSTASTSESLPNLAPPPPAFESSPPPNRDPQSSSGSGSTSSLTSEQSGWVSSRRSSEPSSPDVPLTVSRKPIRYDVPNYAKPETRVTPESKGKSKYSNRNENRKFNTLLNGNEGRTNKNALNGEKLREKLQKLAAENSLKNSILNSKLNNSNSSNRHGNGPRKSSKTNRKSSINRSDNSKLSNRSNGDQKKSILVSDKEFILDVYKSHFLQQNNGDGSEPPPRNSCSIQPISNSSNSLDPDRSLTSPLSIETSSLHPYIRKECPDVALESDLLDELKAVADDDSSLKCEDLVDHPYEELRLPPPQQFRDVPPPPEPFRDPPPAPPLPVDNLLYHVYESVKCKEKKKHNTSEMMKSQSTSELADKLASIEPDEPPVHRKLLADEAEQAFVKARTEFKRQINFSGNLYSDFRTFASSLPYFHISDEYRMFSPEGLHLIICVHGLDGNSADLRLVKTYLELGLPGAHLEFLMSERNQGDTFSDFDTMTDRLVNEILYQIESCNLNPTRISFVGHSLGNIIIRSALTRPQMKPLLSRLHTFLSLSGPHLGTLYNSSGLVNMGMWFMQKWKKSGSLLQLCLRDAADVRQTFLYRLSQRSTLHYFKNVLLCGSSQDRYVPLHSARIELCKAAVRDGSILGCAYREMVHNIVSPMLARRDLTLVRYDVQHALPHTANALIGRAAHIAVLDSELFIEKFMVVAGLKYFR